MAPVQQFFFLISVVLPRRSSNPRGRTRLQLHLPLMKRVWMSKVHPSIMERITHEQTSIIYGVHDITQAGNRTDAL